MRAPVTILSLLNFFAAWVEGGARAMRREILGRWKLGGGLAVAGLLLVSAATAAPVTAAKPPLQHPMLGVANGCFVETVAFLDHWTEAKGGEAWARLLQWGAREDEEVVMGHAVAICEAEGSLWCWDINFGWTRLTVDPAQRDEAGPVLAQVTTRYPRVTARYPFYRFDGPRAPAASVPPPQYQHPNAAVRDASIVGAQLAQKRAVNVVQFAYGRDGEPKRETAAAIFVFHGRYCVYVPEAGTIPFRVRGDVANLRLIQDLLRRMFPGVTGVKKLE